MTSSSSPIKPIDTEAGEQMPLEFGDDIQNEHNQRLHELIDQVSQDIAREHGQTYFTFHDIRNFCANMKKSPQEAGKIFTRFVDGLEAVGLEVYPTDYKSKRDEKKFPLALLSLVISQMRVEADDAYTTLLRYYYSIKIGNLLVKKSTSE